MISTEYVRRTKTGGRQKGTPNRITLEIRMKLAHVLNREMDTIGETLSAMEPTARMATVVKLMSLVMPTEIKSWDKIDDWEMADYIVTDADENRVLTD